MSTKTLTDEERTVLMDELRQRGLLVELGCGCRFVKTKRSETNMDAILNPYTKMCQQHQGEVDAAISDISKGWKPTVENKESN